MEKLLKALDCLIDTGTLPPHFRPHKLTGNHAGEWEAHLAPDWLLVWEQDDKKLVLLLLQTGTHADIL